MNAIMRSLVMGLLPGTVSRGRFPAAQILLKGLRWVESNAGSKQSMVKFHQSGDRLIAHSWSRIFVSEDGKTWEQKPNIPYSCLFFICGDGIYLARYYADEVYVSTDLETWTKATIPTLTENADIIASLEYHNGVFVVTPQHSTRRPHYSLDGINWTQCNMDIGNYRVYLSYQNGMWFGRSMTLFYSRDGITWEKTSILGERGRYSVADVTYGGGVYLAPADSPSGAGCEYYYSTDGINWTERNIGVADVEYRFQWLNGVWFAVPFALEPGLYRSDDGLTWEKVSEYESGSVSYGNGVWVAGFKDSSSNAIGLWYSKDSINWHRSNSPDALSGAIYVGGIFISGRYCSRDGANWVEMDLNQDTVTGVCNFKDVLVGYACENSMVVSEDSAFVYCEKDREG